MLNDNILKRLSQLFFHLRRWFLLGLLLCLLFVFFYFQLYHYLTLNMVKTYQASIQQWTVNHYFSAVTLYLLIFMSLIACTIPCATLLTLVGGFLFGNIAILYAEVGTVFGGSVLYFAVRTAFGSFITAKSSGWIKNMEQGFKQDAFHYILMLRLMPIFPCWISNIGAAIFNVPFKLFFIATVLGVLPSTLIYVFAGKSLDQLLTAQEVNLNIISKPSIFLPLFGLAILSLLPIIFKKIKKQNRNK